MPTWIGFFRGLSVGGKNALPMRELTTVLQELRCTDIRTYIQSGNVVFQNSDPEAGPLARRIALLITREHGIETSAIVLSGAELKKTIASNPFSKAESDPKSLHVFFMESKPKRPDTAKMDALKADTESYAIKGTALYLHAPKGIGTSKLAKNIERLLGVPVTARNWRTVTKVYEMAEKDA